MATLIEHMKINGFKMKEEENVLEKQNMKQMKKERKEGDRKRKKKKKGQTEENLDEKYRCC